MRVLAWPSTSGNPYIADLYRRIVDGDPSVEVDGFSPATAWRHRPDVVHVHWPEIASSNPSLPRAVAKSVVVLATLAWHKARGAKLVWTCHNLAGHERVHPRLDRAVLGLFDRMVDGIIHLNHESSRRLADVRPHLSGRPDAVVPHGHYGDLVDEPPDRHEARAELGLDPAATVLAFVGQIRPYKNVPALIEAFGAMSSPAVLLIAGSVPDGELERQVRHAADGAGGPGDVRLELRWLSDGELALRVRVADAVVLAYRDVNNSGAAILALSLDRPVAVNAVGAMEDLSTMVGDEWVHVLAEPLDGAALDQVAAWAGAPRPPHPDLSPLDPDIAATRTAAFYRQVVDSAS